jgi:hypothetical protein
MNHVLHLMLMGLGREGSISIAYLILLSHIPLDCAFGWRCRGRGPCRCVYARPNGERTVCTMASLPFPFSIPAHDTVSEWSWIFRRKSSDRQIGDRNERVAGTITSARTVARWSYPDTVGRVRTLVHAVQAPHDGDVLRTPTIHRAAAAGPYMYPLVPTANSAHSVALSPAFSSA